jgi:hypothetical protein
MHLLNSTIFHNTQCDPFPALINMLLIEHQRAILGDKITKHACKHATIKS